MIKLIIFDLDGVLVSSKRMHFEALNKALGDRAITWEEHVRVYDGLPTYKKLALLGIPEKEWADVWRAKQEASLAVIKESVMESRKLQDLFTYIHEIGVKVAVASNSIRQTVIAYMEQLGLSGMIDDIWSNELVVQPKPNPEIYLKCMASFSAIPCETLIVEDSFYGLKAAYSSGAQVMQVHSPDEVTKEAIKRYFSKDTGMKALRWVDDKATVLIPMAGEGSRFSKAGYTFPKPLIDVNGKPMVQVVVDSLGIDAKYAFIVKAEHSDKYHLGSMLNQIVPGSTMVQVEGVTEGAACTTLIAKFLIDNSEMLVIANSDQFIEWDPVECLYEFMNGSADAMVLTFRSTHPQWSYVKTDEEGFVIEVAEKRVISDQATVGVYIWRHGSDYVKYAEQMIKKGIRHNGEFYVAPVFNEAIGSGLRVKTFQVGEMWGLGTPELLERFLKR